MNKRRKTEKVTGNQWKEKESKAYGRNTLPIYMRFLTHLVLLLIFYLLILEREKGGGERERYVVLLDKHS